MATAVINHQAIEAQALTKDAATSAKAATSTKADASTSSSSSATISANDFLTLLVTELKNQDPTASTDPNEYVNQLVAVNSLEQLININSTLTTAVGGSSSTTSTEAKAATTGLTDTSATAQSNASSSGASVPNAIHTAASRLAPGNLSVPATNASAQTVAQALSGQRKSM
jgi:flagellar basal-body rod modification protein FlgD